MAWTVPVKIDDITYPLHFEGEDQPSQEDISHAVQQLSAHHEATVPAEGAISSLVRPIASNIFPALATAAGGLAAGTAALPTGPGAIAFDIAGGTAAGAGAEAYQTSVLGDEAVKAMQAQEAANMQAHPFWAKMGQAIGQFPAMLGGGAGFAREGGVLTRIGSAAAQGARMSGSDAAQQKIEGAPGSENISIPEEIVKGALTMGPTGFFGPAKSLLGSVGVKAPTDAAILATSNALYDKVVHGKPIDPSALGQQIGADVPGFMVLNALTHGFGGHGSSSQDQLPPAETITSATYTAPDGTVHEGDDHTNAAALAGVAAPTARTDRETSEYGFMAESPDGSQRVVSREEAAGIAQQNGQLKPGADVQNGQLHSDQVDFRPPEGSQRVYPRDEQFTEEEAHIQAQQDQQHEQVADLVENNAVAKAQEEAVPEAIQAEAPLTAAALDSANDTRKDIQTHENLQELAQKDAQAQHDAEQEQYEALLKQKEEEGIAAHENPTKARTEAEAKARTAPEPVEQPAQEKPVSQPTAETGAKPEPVAGDLADLASQLKTAEAHKAKVDSFQGVSKGTKDLAQKAVDDLKSQIQSKAEPITPKPNAEPKQSSPGPGRKESPVGNAEPKTRKTNESKSHKSVSAPSEEQQGDRSPSPGNGKDRQKVTKTEPLPEPTESQAERIGLRLVSDKKWNKLADANKIEEANKRKAEITAEEIAKPEVPVKPQPSTKDASKSEPRVETAKQGSNSPTENPEPKKGQSEKKSAFESFLRKETNGRLTEEEYAKADKFNTSRDTKDLEGIPQGRQRTIQARDADYRSQTPEGRAQVDDEVRKVAGKTIKSKDGTKFKYDQDPAYKETDGQGDEIRDLEPEKEDPETGEKVSYAVAGNSVNQPEPTEKHPFVYKLHGLFNTLPSGKEQFSGATIGENGNISKDVWNSKTKNISKEEKGLYESLVPEAFKGDKVNVRMLNEALKDLPSVEVHTYGMEGKTTSEKAAFDSLTHNWFENLDEETRSKVRDFADDEGEGNWLDGLDSDTVDTAHRFLELEQKVRAQRTDELRSGQPKATSYYKSISPFDTEKYPVQRIDVVLPTKDGLKDLKPIRGVNMEDQERAKGLLWAPDNLHENLPNTLGWVMAQYVPHPETGEKTMFIGELQSRWGQTVLKDREELKKMIRERPEGTYAKMALDGMQQYHSLLESWESLALKAAIDTARREGVSKVILSDAESAMMTEGHDKAAPAYVISGGNGKELDRFNTREAAERNLKDYQAEDPTATIKKGSVDQEGGMRAQYDRRGPDILRKITGDPGREVDMGPHKNADVNPSSEDYVTQRDERGNIIKQPPGSPVFKTPEGAPRKNVGGREYDISNLSDTANQYASRSGLGVAPESARKAISDFTDRNPFLRGKIILHTGQGDLRTYVQEHPESKRVMDQTISLMDQGVKISGFVDPYGVIHVFSPNAPASPKGLERLLAHEVFHRGEEYARVYAPDKYADLQKAKSQITDAHLAELGDGDYSKILPDWRTDKKQRNDLQTEWITRQIERGALDTAPPDSVLGRIWAALKGIWAKVTGNNNPTDQEIQEMYRAMTKVQESGRSSPKEPFEPKFSDKNQFKAAVGAQVTQGIQKAQEYKDKTLEDLSRSFKGIAAHGLDAAKSVYKAGLGLVKFTEGKKRLGEMQAGLKADGTNTSAKMEAFEKSVPLERRRSAISVYRQAEGDQATLKKWQTDAQGKSRLFDRAVEDAQNLSPEEKQWADQVSDWYDEGAQLGYSTGHLGPDVLLDGSKSYVNHLWETPISKNGKDSYAQLVSKLQRNFKFGRAAKHENFYEGVMAGLKPKTLDSSRLLGIYENHLDTTIRHNQLIKDWTSAKASDGKPMVVIKGADVTSNPLKGGSKVLDPNVAKKILDADGEAIAYKTHPDPRLWDWKWMGKDAKDQDVMMKGNLAFHPEAYPMVDSLLSQSALKEWAHSPSTSAAGELAKTGFRLVDTLNKAAKEGMFGLSAFHMVREGTQALGHRLNPLTGLSDFSPQNTTHMDAVSHGMTLPGTGEGNNAAMEGLTGGNGWLKRVPGIGQLAKFTSDQTWKYVRSLKLKGYEQLLPQYMDRYKGEIKSGKVSVGDVKHKLATDMNDSFGGQNFHMLGRSPTVQHILSLALVAPDFFQSNLKSTISAVGGLTGAKGGREQALAMATLAVGSYAVARALNAALNNGDTKTDHPFSVVSGNREYTMRTLPEDIYKAITNTQQFAMGRLSPITSKPAVELLTGKNYRGEKISPLDTMKDAALAGVPMSLRELPGLRQLTSTTSNNPVSPLESALGTLGVKISKFSPVSKAYYIANEYKASIGKQDTGTYPTSQYAPLKNALEDLDYEKAGTEIQKLKQTMKPDELAKAVHASLFHAWMPDTKSELAYAKYLKADPEKRAIVAAAEARKVSIWKRFTKISGLGRDLPVGMPVPRS